MNSKSLPFSFRALPVRRQSLALLHAVQSKAALERALRTHMYRGIASFYDLLFGSVIGPLSLVGVALSRPRVGMRVLDVCCGTGSHLGRYQLHQCALFGLDASPDMLAVAQARLGTGAHLDRGDATCLPYANSAFDLVSCQLALHSISAEDRAAVLEEARRVLKPDGRILLIDFHPGPYELLRGWLTRAAVVAVEFIAGGEHYGNHRQFMASGGLRGLAHEQGLQIERQLVLNGGNFAVQCLVKPP
jgi:ubiquinone/menaquinone biosynthesis C-methylase UbiE